MTHPDFDITIHGGTVVTEDAESRLDVGITDGIISALAPGLPAGRRTIEATGRIILPGGIDSHCHVEQLSSMGVLCADDWYSASVSAAFGGNTTIIPFAAQHRGQSLAEIAKNYAASANEKSVIDFSYHLIISDPTAETLNHHLPSLIRQGITSFKVFMTYDMLKLEDKQLLDVFAIAAREGALPMIHAENNDVISWIAKHLLSAGYTAPKYHAISHDAIAEGEATNRAISLASVLEIPVLIVHVSTRGGVQSIQAAQTLGAQVFGETCPHYLLLTADDIDIPGVEGAKFCCSPPPRDRASQQALWQSLKSGTLTLFSSDHAPYRYDESGKLPSGENTTFKQIANGLPGIELRMPLLFSEGVCKGQLTLGEFAALTATNHARMYGLYPQKGVIAVGADADLAIWDPERRTSITAAQLHDSTGYTPYEGKEVTGWPVTVINRGDIIIDKGTINAKRGRGQFLPRGTPAPLQSKQPISPRASFLRKIFPDTL